MIHLKALSYWEINKLSNFKKCKNAKYTAIEEIINLPFWDFHNLRSKKYDLIKYFNTIQVTSKSLSVSVIAA